MDNLTKKQRELELNRIAEAERKRQEKITNFEKISPEKAKFLKERKSRIAKFREWVRHVNEPETPKPEEIMSEEQKALRETIKRIHNEDFPPEREFPEGLDLWNTTEKRKEQNRS